MAALARVRTVMSNFPGSPGYTNLYYANVPSGSVPLDAIRTFFETLKAAFPTGAVIQVPGQGDIIDDTNGVITGEWNQGAPLPVTCTGTGNYSGASGAVVNWHTSGIVNSRRVRGRTFLVPTVTSIFDAQGSLASSWISTITAAGNGLIAATGADLAVWARPFEGDPEATPPKAARQGSSHIVTAASVPDLAAVLRSRRT